MDMITLAAAKSYTKKTLDDIGSLQGKDGKSAYQIWLDNGNKGTEQDFLNSLKGPKGDTGATGAQGPKGDTGATGPKGDKGDTGAQGPKGDTGEVKISGAIVPTEIADKVETTDSGEINANIFYDFGLVTELSLTFIEGDPDKVNEYMFSFTSGETVTVLTLPSSIQWVNELTVEPNKRYEVSIVDNIGLWCAVDLVVVAE